MNVYYEHDIKYIRNMSNKIDLCINRVLKNKPRCTGIKLKDDEWKIKPLGLI